MRVLQISSAVNFGGGERHFADLCAGLLKGGHEVFAAIRPENGWLDKLDFLPERNVLRLPLRNSFDVQSARRIAKFVEQKNVRVVHAHLARDYPVAAIAARLARAKLVLTRHLLFPLNFSYKFVLPRDTVFIAVSNGVRRALLEQNILPPEQIRLVYNGIDAQRFASANRAESAENLRRRYDLKPNSALIGIAGELAAHKGQTDFVRAAAKILEQFPEAEFFIAGRDQSKGKKYQNQVENLIAALNLPNRIHLLGWVEDAAAFYAALDVFVSASLVEPFGLVIAEAMATGCAVVSTKTDGATEIIEDGATGKLVSIENPLEMSRAVCDFLRDESLRRAFTTRAQKAASEAFGVERMIAETEKIYLEG